MIKIDKVVTAFCLFSVLSSPVCHGTINTYYVSCKPSVQCLVLNISGDSASSCKTFNEYATESTLQLDTKDHNNTLMSFLQGVHNLSRNFTTNQNLTMTGQTVQTLLLLHQGNITVQNTIY